MNYCFIHLYKYILILGLDDLDLQLILVVTQIYELLFYLLVWIRFDSWSRWPRLDSNSQIHLELSSSFQGLLSAHAKAITGVIIKTQNAAGKLRVWWPSLGEMEGRLMNNSHGNLQSHRYGRIRIMTSLTTFEWKTLGWWESVMALGPNTVRNSPPISLWSMLALGKGNFEILTLHVMRHQSYTCSLIADPLSREAAHPPRSGK